MKILLVAYKIEAGQGSEDSCGYNFASCLLARNVELTLVTRRNNAALLASDPRFTNVNVIGIDVPKVLSFYKKKGRGVILYYYIWQIFVGRLVQRMQRKERFDVVHQFNFHADWAPHFLTNPHGTMVWGPVVHHERVPRQFLKHAGLRARIAEWARFLTKQFFWRCDPFLRRAVARTNVIIYGNKQVAPAFRSAVDRIYFRPYATSSEGLHDKVARPASFRLLSIGRLVPLKGFDVTLDAFAQFLRRHPQSNATLTVIGRGPLHQELARRATAIGISGVVEFIPWLPQAELSRYYTESAAFIFPSFESQGLVVAEAMAAGLPVVCLNDSGPSFVAGEAGLNIARGTYDEVVSGTAEAIAELWMKFSDQGSYLEEMSSVRGNYLKRLTAEGLVDDVTARYFSDVRKH